MKDILVLLVSNLASIVFAVGSVYLASKGREGYGWCIFAAIVCSATLTYSK